MADCSAAAAAALGVAASNGTPTNIDLDRGVFCPTEGLLFAMRSCPAGSIPPKGGQWIGHALITYAGSIEQGYVNIAKDGEVVRAHLVAIATPEPSPSPS